MATHPIRIVGDPVLHHPAAPVTSYDESLRSLIADMVDTNAAANGAGLAAPQIGVPLRVFVYSCADATGRLQRGHVINPVLRTGPIPVGLPDPEHDIEGCLSVPGEHFPTSRAAEATVTGYDETGEPVTVVGTGILAVALQHEVGHLDGLLYLDRLVGRYKREARRVVRGRGWRDGDLHTWLPGSEPDPFGH
jgi:peptide deformylase